MTAIRTSFFKVDPAQQQEFQQWLIDGFGLSKTEDAPTDAWMLLEGAGANLKVESEDGRYCLYNSDGDFDYPDPESEGDFLDGIDKIGEFLAPGAGVFIVWNDRDKMRYIMGGVVMIVKDLTGLVHREHMTMRDWYVQRHDLWSTHVDMQLPEYR